MKGKMMKNETQLLADRDRYSEAEDWRAVDEVDVELTKLRAKRSNLIVWRYKAWLLDDDGKPVEGIEEQVQYSNKRNYDHVMGFVFGRAAKQLKPTWRQAVCVEWLVREF